MDTERMSFHHQQPQVENCRALAKPAWHRPTVTRISMKNTMVGSQKYGNIHVNIK
jgi:hypothetical protein